MFKKMRKLFFKEIFWKSDKNKKQATMFGFMMFVFIAVCFYFASFSLVWKIFLTEADLIPRMAVSAKIAKKSADSIAVLETNSKITTLAAVIIDNQKDGWPTESLSKAIFVWEAPVEADITRFMAIYPLDKDVTKIGPVRSLRPYFIDWAAEFGAMIVHCGGSAEALEKARTTNVRHLDQFFFDQYFWRTWTRVAPHNLLTSISKLKEAVKFKGYAPVQFDLWKFKGDAPKAARPKSQEITINNRWPEYVVNWVYDPLKNDYIRKQNGIEHTDVGGEKIRAKNIVVQFVEIEVLDEVGRRYIKTVGTGTAIVFLDGKKFNATWEKKTRDSRTKFYDKNGKEIYFNPGKTWIDAVPLQTDITVD